MSFLNFPFDLDWITILFAIHLDPFKEKKLKELAPKAILTRKSQFDKLGFETF